MSDLVPVKRALISVSDKSGLAEFAGALVNEFKVQLISTGGTARFLRDAGLPVTDVSEVTGFPEMMDGRVKTLHPKIHGGLLALRDNPEHVAAMQKHDIQAIDLVCINLYPFEKTVARPDVTFEEAIENIDIGGPSMVRSAAKNHRFVLVVTGPGQYEKVLGDLRKHDGSSCGKHRLKQAQRAFAHTAAYDGHIAEYLSHEITDGPQGATGGGTARFALNPQHGVVATAAPASDLPRPAWNPPADAPRSGPSKVVRRLLDSSASMPEFLHELLIMQATLIVGTEAIVFTVQQREGQFGLQTVDHIRPDNSDTQVRAAAVQAFRKLVGPCVQQSKDGAIEVAEPGNGAEAQYCLVTLLRDGDKVTAVSAVITHCADLEAARRKLTSMQIVAGFTELLAIRSAVRQLTPVAPSASAPTPAESGILERMMKLFGFSSSPAITGQSEALPERLSLSLLSKSLLRYGENPHQKAALYVAGEPREASVAFAKQHHGKELSYINLLDADAALAAVKELASPAACIVKHATPCGFATAADLPTAFRNAFAGDPLAAFGGIVALNHPVDRATAEAITSIDKLLEVVVAPGYAPDALELLKTRWKNVRLLEVSPVVQAGTVRIDAGELALHKIVGGFLVQQRDLTALNEGDWKVVSQRQPTPAELADLRLAWIACKHVKSNAIVIAGSSMMYGSGAGQQDRVNACRIAIQKAGDRAKGAVAASDAFFPFPDGPELLLDAGISAIIQPGGSVKDQQTIDLVNQRGAAMLLTGQRHFRH